MSVGVLFVILLLILVNAFYVAAEFGSVSVRRSRIQQRAEEGNWLAAHPEATRIRRSVEEIVTSGLTLAKLTVAANLLGDMVKG